MRSTFLLLMALPPILGMVNVAWFGAELRRFVARTPMLASTHDLERFKRVVARQMYAALVQLPLVIAPAAVYGLGLFSDVLVVRDIAYVIGPSLALLLLARQYKRLEADAQTLACADDLLRAERDRIVDTWRHKALPDW